MNSASLEHPVYFDHAATSFPKPACVPEAVFHYMSDIGSNVNRGTYSTAYDAEYVMFETREALTDFFHGDDCKNTIFTANVTTSLNMLIKGLLKPGDHVLVSSMEHNAVMRPLIQLAAQGITFDRIPCDPVGEMDVSILPSLLRPNTRAIICTHASNVCGTLLPAAQIGQFCQEHGLFFLMDCAQTAGLFPIDMQEMHIDALAFTGHKGLLGPQGTGGFLLRKHMLPLIEPLISGGTGSVSQLETVPEFMPDRFEPGTPNIPGIYGLHAALGYLKNTGISSILSRELKLTGLFLDGLTQIPGIRIAGRQDIKNRAAVVSIQMDGIDLAAAAHELASDYQIQTRVGLHCAPSAHKTLGTYPTGTIRFSFGHKNTEEEIFYCLNALEEILYNNNSAI